VKGSYADRDAVCVNRSIRLNHPLGEVLTALIQAGLALEFVHEFPFTVYPAFPF